MSVCRLLGITGISLWGVLACDPGVGPYESDHLVVSGVTGPVAQGDIDGDGVVEAVTGSGHVFDSSGRLQTGPSFPRSTHIWFVSLEGRSSPVPLWQTKDGALYLRVEGADVPIAVEGRVYGAAVGDVTGEGNEELVVAFGDSVEVYELASESVLARFVGADAPETDYTEGATFARRVECGDFDGDGYQDLLILGDRQAFMTRGQGDGQFGPLQNAGLADPERPLVVDDLGQTGASEVFGIFPVFPGENQSSLGWRAVSWHQEGFGWRHQPLILDGTELSVAAGQLISNGMSTLIVGFVAQQREDFGLLIDLSDGREVTALGAVALDLRPDHLLIWDGRVVIVDDVQRRAEVYNEGQLDLLPSFIMD